MPVCTHHAIIYKLRRWEDFLKFSRFVEGKSYSLGIKNQGGKVLGEFGVLGLGCGVFGHILPSGRI